MQKAPWLTGMLLGSVMIAAGVAAAAPADSLCSHGEKITKGDTVACYSDEGCRLATSLGGDPVRDFDEDSAPFALARGKIAAIVTSSTALMQRIRKAGGSCRKP